MSKFKHVCGYLPLPYATNIVFIAVFCARVLDATLMLDKLRLKNSDAFLSARA